MLYYVYRKKALLSERRPICPTKRFLKRWKTKARSLPWRTRTVTRLNLSVILKINALDEDTEEYISIDDEELLEKLFDLFKQKYEGDIEFE